MRDNIAAYKGAIIEGKIEIAKNMLMETSLLIKSQDIQGLPRRIF